MGYKMNTNDLRASLQPRGTKPIVRLDLSNNFFKLDFIEKCIRQIEMKCFLEGGLNPLEQLGATILFDTAGVRTDGPHNPTEPNVP